MIRRPVLPVMVSILISALLFTGTAAHAQRSAPIMPGQRGMGGPMAAGEVELKSQQVPYTITMAGRAVAVQQVDIRPRITGMINSIDYMPGVPLKKGTLLFTVDPVDYKLDVQAATANVQQATASLEAAKVNLKRLKSLEGIGVTSTQVETAQVAMATAQSALSTAKANLQRAELNLHRTRITSPIDGVADIQQVAIGDIVTANQSLALTTVTQMDPIYVDVEESSARIQRIQQKVKSGMLRRSSKVQAHLMLESGETYTLPGTVISAGSLVSETTGSTTIRVQFDNPNGAILPGQYLRMNITVGTINAVLVPQGVTNRESDGTLTAWIDKDGKAQNVNLQAVGSYNNQWIVIDGVQAGDKLIVDNLRRIRPGAEIKAVPATINANGVVEASEQPTEKPEPKSGNRPGAGGGR